MSSVAYAMYKIVNGAGESFGGSLVVGGGDKINEQQLLKRSIVIWSVMGQYIWFVEALCIWDVTNEQH